MILREPGLTSDVLDQVSFSRGAFLFYEDDKDGKRTLRFRAILLKETCRKGGIERVKVELPGD